MKKTVSLLLISVLLFMTVPALAAGKLEVARENFIVTSSYGLYGYAYARVENTGDSPVKVSAGLLEMYDQRGDVLTSTDYLSEYAEYLQPGEYTYAMMYHEVENTESAGDVADYSLTVSGMSDDSGTTLRFPVETDYQEDVNTGYWEEDCMYATVTNDTDEIYYDIEAVLVLLDEQDNILCIEDETMYNVGLMPGSSVTFREEVPEAFKDYFAANGIQPTHVDAIAYVNIGGY